MRILAPVVLGALCTISSLAVADDEIAKPTAPAAQEHLTNGIRLYRVGNFDEAIKEYTAGALAEDAPVFYYNLGQCYRQLGNYDKAIWNYQRFLERAKPLPEKYKTAVEGFIREMTAEKERAARNTPPTGPAPEPKSGPDVTPPPRSAPRIETVIEHADPWYADKLGWSLAGGGLVATGVATWLVLDARGIDEDANDVPNQSARSTLRDRADSRRVVGAIVGIAGGAALVAGIVKLALTAHDRERPVNSAAVDVTVGPNGFAVMGRF